VHFVRWGLKHPGTCILPLRDIVCCLLAEAAGSAGSVCSRPAAEERRPSQRLERSGKASSDPVLVMLSCVPLTHCTMPLPAGLRCVCGVAETQHQVLAPLTWSSPLHLDSHMYSLRVIYSATASVSMCRDLQALPAPIPPLSAGCNTVKNTNT
jgi:hypothetical protein